MIQFSKPFSLSYIIHAHSQTTPCNTLQRPTTPCNTVHHTATHCDSQRVLSHSETPVPPLTHTHDAVGGVPYSSNTRACGETPIPPHTHTHDAPQHHQHTPTQKDIPPPPTHTHTCGETPIPPHAHTHDGPQHHQYTSTQGAPPPLTHHAAEVSEGGVSETETGWCKDADLLVVKGGGGGGGGGGPVG